MMTALIMIAQIVARKVSKKMGIANTLNKNRSTEVFSWSKQHTDEKLSFFKLAELYDEQNPDKAYPIVAAWINSKGKYKPHGVLVVDMDNGKKFIAVDVPEFMTDSVEQLFTDNLYYDAINAGKLGFTIYTYDSKRRKNCYSIKFVDIE